MTQLTAAQAAYINKMNPASKKVGLGTRVRALEGGSIAAGTDGQVPVCDGDGIPTPVTLSGAGTITNAGVLKITKIAAADADASKVFGLLSTRNTADNSMYVAVADSSGYERGWKIAFSPGANGGGYFESAYINTKVNASMAGIIRASEHKVSITGTANMSGTVAAVLGKLNVETGATMASGVAFDAMLDPEGSATVTAAAAYNVQSNAKWTSLVDLSAYHNSNNSSVKLPNVDGNAAVSIAALETAFGTDDNKEGIIGLYQDNADAVWLILGNSRTGQYQKVASTAVAA